MRGSTTTWYILGIKNTMTHHFSQLNFYQQHKKTLLSKPWWHKNTAIHYQPNNAPLFTSTALIYVCCWNLTRWHIHNNLNPFLPRYCYSYNEIGLLCLTSGDKGLYSWSFVLRAFKKYDLPTLKYYIISFHGVQY